MDRSLHPSFVRVEVLTGWIVTAFLTIGLGLGLGLLLFQAPLPAWGFWLVIAGALLVFGGLCWAAQCWPAIDYRFRSYRVNEEGIQIRKGVLWRTVIDVPRSRVQHTDVNQGPIERRFGLAHLVIHTAGTISASVKLEGLDYETAVALRDHLLASGSGDAV